MQTWLPQALSIGVEYRLFWDLTPNELTPFVTAFKQRQEYNAQLFSAQTNFASWLQGVYFARAIAANFSKNVAYFSQPIELGQPGEPPSMKQQNVDAIKFEVWANSFNKKFRQDNA